MFLIFKSKEKVGYYIILAKNIELFQRIFLCPLVLLELLGFGFGFYCVIIKILPFQIMLLLIIIDYLFAFLLIFADQLYLKQQFTNNNDNLKNSC